MGQALLGLIGWPISHTASPAMMNQAFAQVGKDAVYLPFAVSPDDLSVALSGLAAIGAHGVNVTIPHKTGAYEWVRERTEEAILAGAVNTIRFDHDNGHIGHNTDVIGWWKSIESYFPDEVRQVTILGAGGAALAITAALTLYRPEVTVHVIARNGNNRSHLYSRFSNRIEMHVFDWEFRNQIVEQSDLVVNTTPIGMWPNVDESPIVDSSVFHAGQIVQDIVYRPFTTRFMALAKEKNATVVDGLSMLVGQGTSAYEWWFGELAPTEVMYQAAKKFVLGNISR
jgi:shikimate dehydrogenase